MLDFQRSTLDAAGSAAAGADLFDRLRTETAADHRRLERALDLLREPLSRARFTGVLQGFLSFHRVWEPALAQHGALASLLTGRSRIAALTADLAALGCDPAGITAPSGGAALAADFESALGSLYVMEGSTLGGAMISRTLAGAPWLPAGGLTYFNPYGTQTGVMWRGFKEAVQALAPTPTHGAIVAGARATFNLLYDELTAVKS